MVQPPTQRVRLQQSMDRGGRVFLSCHRLFYGSLCGEGLGRHVFIGAKRRSMLVALLSDKTFFELYIVCWSEIYICVAAMCVLALVTHGRREGPLCRCKSFETQGTKI